MKRLALIFIFAIINTALSQDNANKCLALSENISRLIENKNFLEAKKTWTDLNKKCTNLNEKFYQNGETIFENQKEQANSVEEKKAIAINLIKLFTQYEQKFPANKNTNGIKKALYLSYYNIGTNNDIFTELDRDFKKDNVNFKNPEALYLYFDSFLKEYQSNKKSISIDDLISKNIEIVQTINTISNNLNQQIAVLITKQKTETLNGIEYSNLKKYSENLESLNNASIGIKSLLDPFITCESLNKYCNAKFETNQNNAFWLETVTENLFSKNCFTDLISEKIVLKSYEINPSSKTTFNLGYINFIKNNTEKAILLFNEAAEKVSTNNERAEIYYSIATVVFGINNKQKSFEYLQKALDSDASLAKAYLYQTQLLETGIDDCKTTDFEKKAINWLLAKTVEKAGIANKMYEKSIKTKVENYLKKTPTKTEIKAAGFKEGDKLSINCWINQIIEIPKF